MVGDVPSEVTNRTNRTLRDSAKGQFRPRTFIGDMSLHVWKYPKPASPTPKPSVSEAPPFLPRIALTAVAASGHLNPDLRAKFGSEP